MSRRTVAKVNPAKMNGVSGLHESQLALDQLQSDQLMSQIQDLRSELESTRQLYDRLLTMMPVGYLTLDRRGTIQTANEAAEKILGLDYVHLAGKSFIVFVSKRDFRA